MATKEILLNADIPPGGVKIVALESTYILAVASLNR